jgi:hypothetical protein
MNLFRGIIMLALGAFVIFKGWQIQTHPSPAVHFPVWAFYAVGAIAIAMGVWRLLKKPPKPQV